MRSAQAESLLFWSIAYPNYALKRREALWRHSYGCVVMSTVVVTNGAWPSEAQKVRNDAGLEPAFASLRMP